MNNKEEKLYMIMDDTDDIGSKPPEYTKEVLNIREALKKESYKYFK